MKKILFGFVTGFSIICIPQIFARFSAFPDVPSNAWFAEYVNEIKDWGVINGNDDGTFAPENNINRAEFAKMLTLYDKRVDKKVSQNSGGGNSKTVMYLQKFNADPNNCPSGWKEADYGKNWEDKGTYSWRRTCYTEQNCSVMYLEKFNAEPSKCPNGFNEANYGINWQEGGKNKYGRACYSCN